MDLIVVVIVGCSLILFGAGIIYVRDKIATNRKFKPIPIREAEETVKALIIKRYGKKKNHMRLFYEDFIQYFPQFDEQNYSYAYILHCLSPTNRSRSNPDLIESALIFFERPLIVEGSSRHYSMTGKTE